MLLMRKIIVGLKSINVNSLPAHSREDFVKTFVARCFPLLLRYVLQIQRPCMGNHTYVLVLEALARTERVI